MQDSTFDFRPENTISPNLIAKWRKDVVEDYTIDSLYSMITKYFSQVGDSLTIINAPSSKKFKQIIEKESRTYQTTSFKEFVKNTQDNLHKQFFEKSELTNYLDCFLYNGKTSDTQKSIKLKSGEILHGNCIQELEKIEGVHNMVTSPPYYNAREYTQWLNLYDYLHDMYLVAGRSFQSLQKGGVFFFNIGDIFDNEKITVTSKMGGKRIPLGAYIILIFQKAGFELLDNVIWNKGEPQSNRHKNDGNNVPYYQRPANCYEHIFIFKKPGAKLQLNKNKEQRITTNHQKFTPVFKIFGKEKVNKYGHTAPFPEYVPRMSMLCFTNEDDVVLDPFAGSGTTVFTAIKENRCGVGIELNKEYVKLSKKKIKENT
jgi:DNA modification methylase